MTFFFGQDYQDFGPFKVGNHPWRARSCCIYAPLLEQIHPTRLQSSMVLLRFETCCSRKPIHFAPAVGIRKISRRRECPNRCWLLYTNKISLRKCALRLQCKSRKGQMQILATKVKHNFNTLKTQAGRHDPMIHQTKLQAIKSPQHLLRPSLSRSAKRLIVALTTSPSTARRSACLEICRSEIGFKKITRKQMDHLYMHLET